jgi:TM2 domain-containing membrane protein YozV
MRRKEILASVLSLIIPGLGQMYLGKTERGAAILISVIIVGNLNVIYLSVFALPSQQNFFNYALPRGLHDLFAFYGIVFLIWQVVDAYLLAKESSIAK